MIHSASPGVIHCSPGFLEFCKLCPTFFLQLQNTFSSLLPESGNEDKLSCQISLPLQN